MIVKDNMGQTISDLKNTDVKDKTKNESFIKIIKMFLKEYVVDL